jgi:formate dehydrogenase maturation protein FdhE
MGKNKVVEWYCTSCEEIKSPKQQLLIGPQGPLAVQVRPATCPDCNTHLQRKVTRV